MQIPETVKIGNLVYRTEVVEDLRAEDDRNAKLFGEVSHIDKVLRLRAGSTPEQTLSTFIHECLHVIDDQLFMLDLSERDVKRLGAGLAMLLLDNHLLREE